MPCVACNEWFVGVERKLGIEGRLCQGWVMTHLITREKAHPWWLLREARQMDHHRAFLPGRKAGMRLACCVLTAPPGSHYLRKAAGRHCLRTERIFFFSLFRLNFSNWANCRFIPNWKKYFHFLVFLISILQWLSFWKLQDTIPVRVYSQDTELISYPKNGLFRVKVLLCIPWMACNSIYRPG